MKAPLAASCCSPVSIQKKKLPFIPAIFLRKNLQRILVLLYETEELFISPSSFVRATVQLFVTLSGKEKNYKTFHSSSVLQRIFFCMFFDTHGFKVLQETQYYVKGLLQVSQARAGVRLRYHASGSFF